MGDLWLGVPLEEILYEDGRIMINYSFEDIKEKITDICQAICDQIMIDQTNSP